MVYLPPNNEITFIQHPDVPDGYLLLVGHVELLPGEEDNCQPALKRAAQSGRLFKITLPLIRALP